MQPPAISNGTGMAPTSSSFAGGTVSMDDIRLVAGRQEDSVRLHQLRRQQPEAYNVESQLHSQLFKKTAVYSAVTGCSFAAVIFGCNFELPSLPWRAMGLSAVLPIGAATGYVMWTMLSTERAFYKRERDREEWELKNYREGEYDEMTAIYMAKGLSEVEARQTVGLLARDDDTFVDIMMVDELGYSCRPMPSNRDALKASAIACASFAVAATLPLLTSNVRIGQCVLAATTVCASTMQAKLLFGAYADFHDVILTLRNNGAWLGTLMCCAVGTAKVAALVTAASRTRSP